MASDGVSRGFMFDLWLRGMVSWKPSVSPSLRTFNHPGYHGTMVTRCGTGGYLSRLPQLCNCERATNWDGVVYCIRSVFLFRFLLGFFPWKSSPIGGHREQMAPGRGGSSFSLGGSPA